MIRNRIRKHLCLVSINAFQYATAVLQALTSAISHAQRAAMVLDGEPYPYIKWLAKASSATPTGQRIAIDVEEIIDLIGTGALRLGGPESKHPLNRKLREVRRALIDAARSKGIDAPWLNHWYLHLDERSKIHATFWYK